MTRHDRVAGTVWLIVLALLARKVPAGHRYRSAGYVHRRTLASGGAAPLHQHQSPPTDGDHLPLYARTR